LNEIVARQSKPLNASESLGDGSDGASEKSDDEQDDQPAPVDEDEAEEEETQAEDMEVSTRHRVSLIID